MPPPHAHLPADLQSILVAAAPPELELTFQPMFGGIMGYARGRPFASLSNVGLALKLGGADHSELLALPGVRRPQREPDGPPSKSYVVVPDTFSRIQTSWSRCAECEVRRRPTAEEAPQDKVRTSGLTASIARLRCGKFKGSGCVRPPSRDSASRASDV